MKKKFLKLIATLMCIIITCLSVSVGSFATSGEVYEINALKGYYSINSVITNDAGTIAVLNLIKPNGVFDYAVTKNGKDFTILNFDEYLPEESDEIQIFDCIKNGNTFVLYLREYATELVKETYYDEYYDEYYEEEYEKTVLKKHFILKTTNFVDYEKYEINVDISNTLAMDPEWYDTLLTEEFQNMFFCGDVFVLAADFIEITKVVNEDEVSAEAYGGRYLKGVYYTTTDFVNWTKHYTPELFQELYSVSSNAVRISYDYLQSNRILVKYSTGDFYHIMYQDNVYIITDFMESVSIMTEDVGYASVKSVKPTGIDSKTFIKITDVYDYYGYYDYNYSKFELVDCESGGTTLLSKENCTWLSTCRDGDNWLLIEKSGKTTSCLFNPATNRYEKVSDTIGYCLTDNFVWLDSLQEAWIFFANDRLCVSPDGSFSEYEEYNISQFGFNEHYMRLFSLNGKVYIIGEFWQGEHTLIKVAETDISLKRNGDLNGDDKINSSDALLVLQHSVGKITLDDTQKSCADVNKDGKINSSDALMILQYSVGKIDSL